MTNIRAVLDQQETYQLDQLATAKVGSISLA